MPPWNAFAMRHENCTLRGSSLFREREFPGESIFQGEFRRTSFPNYSRARSSRRFHFAGIAKKFIYRKTHTKAELGSKRDHIELTFTGARARATSLLDLIDIARCRLRWRLRQTRKIAYSIHMRETSEDEGEYIKLNTKGALRSVYLCFIIGASRENEHAYI